MHECICWNENKWRKGNLREVFGKEVLSQKQERKGDFRNVVMDLHL